MISSKNIVVYIITTLPSSSVICSIHTVGPTPLVVQWGSIQHLYWVNGSKEVAVYLVSMQKQGKCICNCLVI